MEIDGEVHTCIPLSVRRCNSLIVLVSKSVIDQTMISFISTNHQQSITQSSVIRKTPVIFRDLRRSLILQLSIVNAMNHLCIRVHSVLLEETHKSVGGAGSEYKHEREETDKAQLENANKQLLDQCQSGVGAYRQQVHSLVLSLIDQRLDPFVGLQTS
mgnify:CR=1 FL=1